MKSRQLNAFVFKEHWITAQNISAMRPMHAASIQGVEDMIHLEEMNEAGMVHNLYIRYKENKIYVRLIFY